MTRELLRTLGQRLDETLGELNRLDAYYAGTQPLAFLSPEAKTALGGRLAAMAVNVPRLVVGSLTERLRVTGLARDGAPDPALWAAWQRSQLDQTAPLAHREALTLGRSYALVWARPDGSPRVTVESAHQVAVDRDPAEHTVTAALKRWAAPDGHRAVVYEPDRITSYATATGVPTAESAAWRVTGTVDNPLGVVPMVPLVNADRLLTPAGRSELADVIPLTDALVKITTDMLVTSEHYARPRRWATGIEVPVDENGEPVNPFASEVDRTWLSESPESKFGQFAATDLAAYDNAVTVLLKLVSAVTGLPEHVIGVGSDNPTSADSIRASEAALTARAESKQRVFGRGWEHVAALMAAVATGADPAAVDVTVQWADPSTRSAAQEADATVKLYEAGIIGRSTALRRLGYDEAEIGRIRGESRSDAADTALTRIGSVA